MVKSVVAEETLLKLCEDRLYQSAIPAQVGLVIGKLSSNLDKGFVFDLVPTPPNDADQPACSLSESGRDDRKKGSKGKPQTENSVLMIDRDWVAEHARQVSRMLLGGVSVVGIYVWASESSFKTSSTVLWQTVKVVADVAPFYGSDLEERLLVHISYSPRRWACRNCLLNSSFTSSSLRPCDFKMGRVLQSLQSFKCTYNFEIRLPISLAESSNASSMRDILRNGISLHATKLKNAKALVDGDLVVKDQPSTSDILHEVELLLPFMDDVAPEACSTEEVIGLMVFSGAISSYAYLCHKEPISQVLSDIKWDIIGSLQSRLDILSDEAEANVDSEADTGKSSSEVSTEKPNVQLIMQELREQCKLPFPRRILVPWIPGIFICDYLQQSETFEDMKDHWKEILSMEAPSDISAAILDPETEITPLASKSFWHLVHGNPKPEPDHSRTKQEKNSTGKLRSRESKHGSFNFLSAVVVLISIFIGLGVIYFGL